MNPEPQQLYYCLQFLKLKFDAPQDNLFDFGYPNTTPFSSAPLDILKSNKIYGVAKYGFLNALDPQTSQQGKPEH